MPPPDSGTRQRIRLGGSPLEHGGRLTGVELGFRTWGTPDPDRAVLVLHALTGDSDVAAWWPELLGPGRVLDPERHWIIAPDVLGGMVSTGPLSPAEDGREWGPRFPTLSTRDQVAAEARLADHLGIGRWQLVIGGSVGGQRALEWAVGHPGRVEQAVVIAANARTTADQLAWAHTQLQAIALDPDYHEGFYREHGRTPDRGLSLARQIAHTTYRSAAGLDRRFGRLPQHGEDPYGPPGGRGRFAVQSYLDHHGDRLVERFDANVYRCLTLAMAGHDVGRDRGGVPAALARVTARLLVVALSGDRLFDLDQTTEVAAGVPGAELALVSSDRGHDGFLGTGVGPLVEALETFLAPRGALRLGG